MVVPSKVDFVKYVTIIIDKLKNDLQEVYSDIQYVDFEYSVFQEDPYFESNLTIFLSLDGEKQSFTYLLRFLQSTESTTDELTLHSELEERTKEIPNMGPVEILYSSTEENVIVYQIPPGKGIDEIEDIYLDFLLGVVLSVIHGKSVSNLDLKNFQDSVNLLLRHLPFSDEQKRSLQDAFEEKFSQTQYTLSGIYPCTKVSRSSLKIDMIQEGELDMYSISNFQGFQVKIPIVPVDFTLLDRFTDVGAIYAKQAFDEFSSTKSIDETLSAIESFVAGYNTTLFKNTGLKLMNLYPEGITLDIQLVFQAWLNVASTLNINDVDQDLVDTLYDFSIHLLKNENWNVVFSSDL